MKATRERPGYRCRACGARHPRWQGRCDGCGEWSTLAEQGAAHSGKSAGPIPLPEVSVSESPRRRTGLAELDLVLGGGLVAGSAVLIAGDPGIGKSTLLLQAAGGLAGRGHLSLYVSGEESLCQTRLRADRLGVTGRLEVAGGAIHLLAETNLDTVLEHARSMLPDLVVVDSIQTMRSSLADAAPGSVAQVRSSTADLVAFAKSTGVPVVMIGHVTKTGDVAGPRVLSHIVDAVLSFEGDRHHAHRMLRAVKNRFGPTEEVGVFEMGPGGLTETTAPNGLLLENGAGSEPGSVVIPAAEGSRILLVEIQALASRAPQGPPRRRVTGLDPRRLDLLLAVLEKKSNLELGGTDVFLNAVGGVRIEEPGTDLPAALAVASSLLDRAFPASTVAFGEIGLKGEIRPVSRSRERLGAAAKLGFGRALVPAGTAAVPGIQVVEVRSVTEAQEWLDPHLVPD